MEVERCLETPIKVSGTVPRTGPVLFSNPFSTEIINAPGYGKVKMPTVDLNDGTADPKELLGVYKTHMYVQDIDDVAHPKRSGIVINDLALGSISFFQDLADKFVSQFIASRKERRTSIHLSKIK